MKLAIVTAYPPSKVTLNEYAYHLVKNFRQLDTVTEIVLLTDKTIGEKTVDFTENGCKVTVKECWSFNSYSTLYTVTKAINETKPDSILFNLQFMKFGDKKIAAALGLMLPLLYKLKAIPTIVLLHNILEEVDLKSAGFTKNKLAQYVYTKIGTILTSLILKADLVAVTMQKYVAILQEKYKVNNVVLIPHGTFELPEEPNFNYNKNKLQVMTFGKFGTYKKVEHLIEAVVAVRKETNLAIELVIAGQDNPNAIGYLEEVQKKYKTVKQLTFTGYVPEKKVPQLFKESTVVAFPYTATTGSSGVLHQAGSYGKAVVMPNLGDLALLVEQEGYKGEFFEPESTASLATAIKTIITNPEHCSTLGKANYQAATAYPMFKIAQLYLEHFHAIIKKKNTPIRFIKTVLNLF